MQEEYRTIEKEAFDEFTERRSRFIGYAKPVQTEEQAIKFINDKKKQHWDATHNVYAYRLREGSVQRYSDDGEPQGTAGVPVLDVLQKSDVTDCVVVVTRYFGGILLGAGGLVRAYSHGASVALQAGGFLQMKLCEYGFVACDYSRYGRVAPLIMSHGGVIDSTDYTDQVAVHFHIEKDNLPPLQEELTELSAGDLSIECTGEAFCAFPEK